MHTQFIWALTPRDSLAKMAEASEVIDGESEDIENDDQEAGDCSIVDSDCFEHHSLLENLNKPTVANFHGLTS